MRSENGLLCLKPKECFCGRRQLLARRLRSFPPPRTETRDAVFLPSALKLRFPQCFARRRHTRSACARHLAQPAGDRGSVALGPRARPLRPTKRTGLGISARWIRTDKLELLLWASFDRCNLTPPTHTHTLCLPFEGCVSRGFLLMRREGPPLVPSAISPRVPPRGSLCGLVSSTSGRSDARGMPAERASERASDIPAVVLVRMMMGSLGNQERNIRRICLVRGASPEPAGMKHLSSKLLLNIVGEYSDRGLTLARSDTLCKRLPPFSLANGLFVVIGLRR